MIEFEPMMDMEMFAGQVEMAKPPPKPIEKPQTIPPIRKPEVEKKHIKKTGKK